MSFNSGDGGPPYHVASRTGSMSHGPGISTSYFQDGAQQQHQHAQQHSSTHVPHMPFPTPQQQHRMAWPIPGPSSSSIASSTLQHASTSGQPAGSKRNSSVLVDSPADSRSDTDDPAHGSGNGLDASHSASKRKTTDDPESSRSKKKRNRAVLSCAPCKARKIRCDRNMPCTSCVRRGISEQCHWEDTTKTGAPQPFATSSEVDELRARLENVESLIARIPKNILEAVTDIKAESDIEAENSNDGEEAAVGALESLALGHHHFTIKGRGPPGRLPDVQLGSPALKVTDRSSSGIRAPYNPAQIVEGLQNTIRTESTVFLPVPLSMAVSPVTEFLADLAPSSVIQHIMKALPRKEVADSLVEFYYANCDWMDTCGSERDFRRECRTFWAHLEKRGPLEAIDPAWMAVFFIRMAVAARQMPTSYLSREDPAIVAILPDQFYMASKRCSELADWMIRPQFRILQCLAVTLLYVWFSANRNEGLVLLASAMRIAQVLNLGSLGDDQTTMPPWEDLAFPTGPSVLKRQLSCRVWAHLCFLDNTFSSMKSMTCFYPIRGANTAVPFNLNDEDLHTTELVIKERPLSEYTDVTFFLGRNELVNIWRFIDSDVKHSYDDILAMDKQIRKIIGRLPKVDADGNVQGSGTKRKNAMAQSSLIQSGLSAQLVRLHNPYWFRSFKNPAKYAYAHETCLSAAATVIDCNLQAIRLLPGERFWFLHLHTFSATMCLLLDLMHSIDSDAPNAQLVTEERLRQAESAIEIFQHTKRTSRVPTCQRIGRMGEAIVKATISAAKERQAHRAAGDDRAKESYADTFKGIMAAVADSSATAETGVPPRPQPPHNVAPHNTMQTTGANGVGHYTMLAPQQSQASFTMPAPAIDTSTQDVLQSLGISLDNLVRESPTSSTSGTSNPGQTNVINSSNQQIPGAPFAPDSVFDDLFGSGDFFGQDMWTTANF